MIGHGRYKGGESVNGGYLVKLEFVVSPPETCQCQRRKEKV